MLPYTFIPPHSVPLLLPLRRRGSKMQAARYQAIITRGIDGRYDYMKARKRCRSNSIAHKRTYPSYFVVDGHISDDRRHSMGETFDDLFFSGTYLHIKRKRSITERYPVRAIPLGSPEPVRRRTTHPIVAILGDMEVDDTEVEEMEVDEPELCLVFRPDRPFTCNVNYLLLHHRNVLICVLLSPHPAGVTGK